LPRREISTVKKSEILGLYLRGFSRDEVANKAGVSAGTASSTVSEFSNDAHSSSLPDASAKYDVRETIQALHDVAAELRKAGVTVKEAKLGAELLAKASKIGITLEKFECFVQFCQKITPEGYPVEDLILAAMKLSNLEDETGLDAGSIASEYEAKLSESKELETRVQTITAEIKRLTDEMKRAETDLSTKKARSDAELNEFLQQHQLTLERVSHVLGIEQALRRYGIEIEKTEALLRFLSAVEKLGDDPCGAVKYMDETGFTKQALEDLRQQKVDLENQIIELTDQKVTAEGEFKRSILELEKARPLLDAQDRLLGMGYNSSSLSALADLTLKLGKPEEVFKILESYGSSARLDAKRLELEQSIVKLSAEEETARESVNEIEGRLKPLHEEHEYVARRCGELRKELESYDGIVKVALCLSGLRSGDPKMIASVPVDVVICLLEAIRPWCESKQIELRKQKHATTEFNLGTACSYLIDMLRKIKAG
jgi:transposase-like protein